MTDNLSVKHAPNLPGAAYRRVLDHERLIVGHTRPLVLIEWWPTLLSPSGIIHLSSIGYNSPASGFFYVAGSEL